MAFLLRAESSIMDFKELGLSPLLLAKLKEQNITEPTPIQRQAIPFAMQGRDVMGLAQTGTGKTAAFGLPLLHALIKIGKKPDPKTVRGLILAPTRELVNQIAANLKSFTVGGPLKIGLVVGGVSINGQINRLARGTDIVVATPGRLIDLLERKAITLSQTKFLVLDEADQMLDMGFIEPLRRIASKLPHERQTMLFSATMPKAMAELSKAYLRDPERIEVARPGKAADKITQGVHFVAQGDKQALLIDQLSEHKDVLSLVFSRTKHGAERLMKNLEKAGLNAASIHGNKSQGQRERAIKAFKEGKVKVLVATDVAARGIDIPGVEFVYNYDLPNVAENYVHRIGRTARAGREGQAIAFCAPDEMAYLADIQKVMKIEIPVLGGEPVYGVDPIKRQQPSRRRGSNGGGGGGGRGKPQGQKKASGTKSAAGKPAGGGQKRRNKRRRGPAKSAAA